MAGPGDVESRMRWPIYFVLLILMSDLIKLSEVVRLPYRIPHLLLSRDQFLALPSPSISLSPTDSRDTNHTTLFDSAREISIKHY